MLFDFIVACVYSGGIWYQWDYHRDCGLNWFEAFVSAIFWPITFGAFLADMCLPVDDDEDGGIGELNKKEEGLVKNL